MQSSRTPIAGVPAATASCAGSSGSKSFTRAILTATCSCTTKSTVRSACLGARRPSLTEAEMAEIYLAPDGKLCAAAEAAHA
jgi:hypothetical protein